MSTKAIYLKRGYKLFFLLIISCLLLRELLMGVLMGDPTVLLEGSIYLLMLYFISKNHEQTKTALLAWAAIYLIGLTGVKAGAKTLVILSGNGWEIDDTRYRIDLFLVGLGFFILLFRNAFFEREAVGGE
ncbi:MAG: hypothetical protein AAF960_06640 [Bacteroidota bacterium]